MSKPLVVITGASSGIASSHVADTILYARRVPQNVLIGEMVVTPMRQGL